MTTTTTAATSVSLVDSSLICAHCQRYLQAEEGPTGAMDGTESTTVGSSLSTSMMICQVCGNTWDNRRGLHLAIEQACQPYGGLSASSTNQVALPITVTIAGNVKLRLSHYSRHSNNIDNKNKNKNNNHPNHALFLQDLKRHLQLQAEQHVTTLTRQPSHDPGGKDHGQPLRPLELIQSEQQGYLSIHILCIPPKPQDPTIDYSQQGPNPKKRRRHFKYQQQQQHQQNNSGAGGGDPRILLEERLKAQGYLWWSWSEAEPKSATITDHAMVTPWIAPMEFQVAVFRKPYYFYGYYTKFLRTVSQTPFVVTQSESNHDHSSNATTRKTTMITLGTTSVEEQICAPIIRKWGISKENVNYLKTCNDDVINNNNNNTTYGMCKFHASGREDMDVRMILRPSSSSSSSMGRPFCVQLIDALRPVISDEELQDIVHEINHTDPRRSHDTADDHNSIMPGDAPLVPSSPLWYGHNPMGVGISNKFQIVPASTFSNLQADTETKVKHYGCHCWSERELPPDWTFTLPLQNNNNNNNNNTQYSLPLTIQQQTPLRVLHRRSNLIRERLIFEVHGTRIDAHHFRLELSTQAGTYVKEFVHGDLGRTKPNMASLLQTKTNILLLDCEGIEMDISSTIVPVEGEGGEKTSNDAEL